MRYTVDEVRDHLRNQQRSGLPATTYCKQKGINLWTFRYWAQHRRRKPVAVSAPSAPFVKFALQTPATSFFEISFGGKVMIRIPPDMDTDRVHRLLSAVKRSRIV